MTYNTIATISQVTSLLMFIGMFIAVLVYALWPSNGPRFDAIQTHALGLDEGAESRATIATDRVSQELVEPRQ